jgi:hypothetical protein
MTCSVPLGRAFLFWILPPLLTSQGRHKGAPSASIQSGNNIKRPIFDKQSSAAKFQNQLNFRGRYMRMLAINIYPLLFLIFCLAFFVNKLHLKLATLTFHWGDILQFIQYFKNTIWLNAACRVRWYTLFFSQSPRSSGNAIFSSVPIPPVFLCYYCLAEGREENRKTDILKWTIVTQGMRNVI